ncbi:hypothetical protein KUCAC02_028214 [Chaenocephalus aceratus]|uniref:Uncharacterized protein n=1 Tax=Chaenocephalus aceratus TaxID=36190 RepID=A0ACB9X174_CHAAC|nr:hypothetical protein KUCAC02_028214 [Chaenocephalus aceratus]
MGRAESDGMRAKEGGCMDECIEYVAEGGLSSSPLSSQAGTAGMRMHRSKLGNQTQKRPHQIFTEINSSQAPCEASRLSGVLWEYTESTEQQLCSIIIRLIHQFTLRMIWTRSVCSKNAPRVVLLRECSIILQTNELNQKLKISE